MSPEKIQERCILEFEAGRRAAIINLTNLAQVRNLTASGKYEEKTLDIRHVTKNYKITRWIKPDEIDQCQQFEIDGPGHHDFVYLALSDDCGPQFIRALQAAYDAGRRDGYRKAQE